MCLIALLYFITSMSSQLLQMHRLPIELDLKNSYPTIQLPVNINVMSRYL